MLWCGLELTFDFAEVTLLCKILSRVYISETIRCRKLKPGMNIGWGL